MTFYALSLLLFLSLTILLGLSLVLNYKKQKARSELFVCVKKVKLLSQKHLEIMGKTSWAIKNLDTFAKITLFIPGFQSGSLKAEELKKALMVYQEAEDKKFIAQLLRLNGANCLIKPQFLSGFFQHSGVLLLRQKSLPIFRELKWEVTFQNFYSTLSLEFFIKKFSSIHPRINILSGERMGR